MERVLLTVDQAAEVLNVSTATVYDLIRLRSLDSVKIGRARRIPSAAIGEYVDRLREVSW